MIPIRDTIRSYHFPIVNWLLIGVNTLVFLFEAQLGPAELERFLQTWGLIPARLLHDPGLAWITIFSSMFLHGGWFHFLSNMWFLYIFGDNVEDRMGSWRYLFFYLASGVAAALLQTFVLPDSTLPTIGASGAIAGVLGAYVLFFPTANVTTLVFVFFFVTFVDIPALLYLGFWFVSQFFSGLASLAGQSAGGVAWWAHIGGFVFGWATGRLFAYRHPSYYRWYPDEYWPW